MSILNRLFSSNSFDPSFMEKYNKLKELADQVMVYDHLGFDFVSKTPTIVPQCDAFLQIASEIDGAKSQ